MSTLQAFGSRVSLPGWLFLGLGVLGIVADVEGGIQFLQRTLTLPLPPILPWLPWLLAATGLGYLTRLGYAELINEPLRQVLHASAIPAASHRSTVSRAVEDLLARTGEIGRLARLALEDATTTVEQSQIKATDAFEKRGLLKRLRVRDSQRRLAAFLNSYERAVYRLRDGGLAVAFDFSTNGNFAEWKRFDTELLSTIRRHIYQSRYSHLRDALENSIWKDGVRRYL